MTTIELRPAFAGAITRSRDGHRGRRTGGGVGQQGSRCKADIMSSGGEALLRAANQTENRLDSTAGRGIPDERLEAVGEHYRPSGAAARSTT